MEAVALAERGQRGYLVAVVAREVVLGLALRLQSVNHRYLTGLRYRYRLPHVPDYLVVQDYYRGPVLLGEVEGPYGLVEYLLDVGRRDGHGRWGSVRAP